MPPSRFELLRAATPMGHHKDSPTLPKNQDARRIPRTRRWQQRARRPRSRICLLKVCGRLFRPQQPIARYCSDSCRAEARQWRLWKAHQRYRQSPNGKQKRQAQSRRYRARRKELQARETAAVKTARVIPPNFFFVLPRPPRMLCGVRPDAAFASAAFLFANLSPGSGARSGEGEALARTTAGARAGAKRPSDFCHVGG
jgi:hypothetical protein